MFVKEIIVTSQGSSFTNVLLAITITATSQIAKAPKKNLMKRTENLGSLSQIWKLKSWNLSKLKKRSCILSTVNKHLELDFCKSWVLIHLLVKKMLLML
jgi:hypothetical protein